MSITPKRRTTKEIPIELLEKLREEATPPELRPTVREMRAVTPSSDPVPGSER